MLSLHTCDVSIGVKTAQYSLAICSYFVLTETNILIMDKFSVVKMLIASTQEKKRSHLPVNISALKS